MRSRRIQLHRLRRPILLGRSAGVAALLLLCMGLLGLPGCQPQPPKLVISEVVSSNKLSYPDEALGSPDWVELHNESDRDIDLSGYILTDKQGSYDLKNRLPDIRVPAGGYAVLYARADVLSDAYVLPFGLSKTGDTLYLLDPSGALVERVQIPALPQDVSYARRADGTFGYCILPTPGTANEGEISDVCPEIEPPEEGAQAPVRSDVQLVLNEVASNDLEDGPFGSTDWIELYNPGLEPVSAEGFFLTDREDKPDKAALPAVTVPSLGYAAIPCGGGDGAIDMGISSAGEVLFLYDAALSKVDELMVPALMDGQSWARDRNGVFGYCGVPTPDAENRDEEIGAESIRQADETEPLRLNEVLFRNTFSVIDSYGDHADFVELYNAGSETVSLGEYYLSDDFDSPLKWRCPERTVAPGEYVLIFMTGRKSVGLEIHAPFSVSGSDDGLQLYHRGRRAFQRLPWSDQVPQNTSVGLDANGTVLYYRYPTPGAANAAAVEDAALLAALTLTDVHISEVNASGEDWIELKNGSNEVCNLDHWYLTDSRAGEKRQVLSGKLKAGAYALVKPDAFGVAVTGETLFLYDGAGNLRDVFETGDLVDGVTSGRAGASVERVFFWKATPQKTNPNSFALGRTPAPMIADLSLYHEAGFSLILSCTDPDAVIRYTLDGSEPGSASPIYTEPIPITENVTIRALAQGAGYLRSRTVTCTYLVRQPHTLPVVAVACDPAQFEAYTEIDRIGDYPHTDAHIAFYEADGTLGTAFPAEINPRGNQSIKYPQKSLSIHLRDRLGQGSVNYPFWGPGSGLDYGTLILRNGSQDYTRARLRDSFALRAVENLSLDSARTRPVVVYVNGRYYGVMDFNEGMNQDYLVTHFQADPAAISHISTNSAVRYGQSADFLRVRTYARNHAFSNDKVLETFSQWVDVDYITEYLIAQTLFCNYDIKNQSYWATDDYAIRWRPVFYDIDRCFTDNSYRHNMFSQYFNKDGVVYDKTADRVVNMDLYFPLRENRAWSDRFVRRYAQLLCTEFSVERLQTLLDEMAETLRPEMGEHIALYGKPASLEKWEGYIASMRSEIARRHASVQKQLRTEFHLTEAQWNAIMDEAQQNAQ